MGSSIAEAGINVNTTTKPAAFGRTEYSPTVPKPLVGVPVAGKRQTGPAAMNQCSRNLVQIGGVVQSSPFVDGRRRGVFLEMALLKKNL
jgi:hypothetical protein